MQKKFLHKRNPSSMASFCRQATALALCIMSSGVVGYLRRLEQNPGQLCGVDIGKHCESFDNAELGNKGFEA